MTDVLVDTNILIYSLQRTEQKKHEICSNIVSKLIDDKSITLSIQNLAELSRVLYEKISPQIDPKTIKRQIYEFSNASKVIYYKEQTLISALTVSEDYKIHFFDALIAATMEENGVVEIMTENQKDFSKIPWIKVINPFKKI